MSKQNFNGNQLNQTQEQIYQQSQQWIHNQQNNEYNQGHVSIFC